MVTCSRRSSSSTAARCSGRTCSRSSASNACRRRIPWTDEAPYCLISVTPCERMSSHDEAGKTTRRRPWASQRHVLAEQVRVADEEQHVLEVVHDLNGGGGVVDRGRQRLDGDVDHDADRTSRILLDRALQPERDHAAQPALTDRRRRRGPVELEQRRAGGDELPDRVSDHQRAGVLLGPLHEAAERDRLHGASTRRGRHSDAGACGAWGRRRRVRVGQPGDRVPECPLAGSRDEGGDRHGPKPVNEAIQEDDEQQQADHHEPRGERDADVRHGVRLDGGGGAARRRTSWFRRAPPTPASATCRGRTGACTAPRRCRSPSGRRGRSPSTRSPSVRPSPRQWPPGACSRSTSSTAEPEAPVHASAFSGNRRAPIAAGPVRCGRAGAATTRRTARSAPGRARRPW